MGPMRAPHPQTAITITSSSLFTSDSKKVILGEGRISLTAQKSLGPMERLIHFKQRKMGKKATWTKVIVINPEDQSTKTVYVKTDELTRSFFKPKDMNSRYTPHSFNNAYVSARSGATGASSTTFETLSQELQGAIDGNPRTNQELTSTPKKQLQVADRLACKNLLGSALSKLSQNNRLTLAQKTKLNNIRRQIKDLAPKLNQETKAYAQANQEHVNDFSSSKKLDQAANTQTKLNETLGTHVDLLTDLQVYAQEPGNEAINTVLDALITPNEGTSEAQFKPHEGTSEAQSRSKISLLLKQTKRLVDTESAPEALTAKRQSVATDKEARDSKKSKLQSNRNSIRQKEGELTSLSSKSHPINKNLSTERTKLNRLKVKYERKERELAARAKELSSLRQKGHPTTNDKRRLSEIRNLNSKEGAKNIKLSNSYHQQVLVVKKLQTHSTELSNQFRELMGEVKSLKKDNKTLSDEIESLSSNIQENIKKLNTATTNKKKLEGLEQKFATASSTIDLAKHNISIGFEPKKYTKKLTTAEASLSKILQNAEASLSKILQAAQTLYNTYKA